MGNDRLNLSSILLGSRQHVGASRALAEFRSGRPVVIADSSETLLCLPVEGLDKDRLAAFRALAAPITPRLVLTSSRARSLGIDASEPVAIELSEDVDSLSVLSLVADKVGAENIPDFDYLPEPAGAVAAAAIDLVKLAQVLPAVLVADTDPAIASAFDPRIVTIEAKAVARFRKEATKSLVIAGEAHVPLSSSVRTRFVVFHDALGEDSVAVIVGTPDLSKPVPVRIHSACLTGDVFGSIKCDCGPQLHKAMEMIEAEGRGAIVYQQQEGRRVAFRP